MNVLTKPLVIVFGLVLFLVSCKRTWTCRCMADDYFFKNETKKRAKELCDEKEIQDSIAVNPLYKCNLLSP